MLLVILKVMKLLECFTKKHCKKQIKKIRIGKIIKRKEKAKNYMVNGKVVISHLIVGLIKRYCYIKMSYFTPYGHSKNKIEVESDLSNYATKRDLKRNRC